MLHTDASFRWAAKARAATVFCLAGALVGAGLYLGNRAYVLGLSNVFVDACSTEGSTYLLHKGKTDECVGYTDGSYVFDPRLKDVEDSIKRENHQVTSQHPADYVSVVILLPISSAGASIMSMPNVIDHLRGAYTAQYYANRGNINGSRPYIQLLIGNAGNQANQESTATSAIISTATSQHIAAVTGLGVSLTTTQAAADALTSARIPVVGSSISSDNFDDIPDLIRVSPSNQQVSQVAVKYARGLSTKAVLVEDDNANDIYDSNLVTDLGEFQDATHTIIGRESYDTTDRDAAPSPRDELRSDEYVQDRIKQMVPDICAAQPAVVLFAGRGHDLQSLVGDLANRPRPCLGKPIRIVTGDDLANLVTSSAVNQGLDRGVAVYYAALADKDEWTTGTGATVPKGQQGFTTFESAFRGRFPSVPLAHEDLMMSYDATLTAISAIRLTGRQQPAAEAVSAELPALQGVHTVLGASGPLTFSADRQNSQRSNPVNKAIPMLQYRPNGDPKLLGLGWSDGKPPSH